MTDLLEYVEQNIQRQKELILKIDDSNMFEIKSLVTELAISYTGTLVILKKILKQEGGGYAK